MKNKLFLLIVSIIITILSFRGTLLFSCNNVRFGIVSGVFGSALCFFITSIIDYFVSRKRALLDYLDFVIHFRKDIRKIKPCSIEPEKALNGILSLDGSELLYYNRKYYNWLSSNNKKIRSIYNTINVYAEAISNFNMSWDKSEETNDAIKELQTFDKVFFYTDGDIIKSFLDHQDFINFVNGLNDKVNDDYSLEFDKIAYYDVDKDITLDGCTPWSFPVSKIKNC